MEFFPIPYTAQRSPQASITMPALLSLSLFSFLFQIIYISTIIQYFVLFFFVVVGKQNDNAVVEQLDILTLSLSSLSLNLPPSLSVRFSWYTIVLLRLLPSQVLLAIAAA